MIKLTVQRNNEVDGTIRSPFFDFANIRSQGRLIHSTVENLAPR